MKRGLLIIVAVLLAGSMILGGMVWAQGPGSGGVPPLEPGKTISGSGPGEELPSTHLGDVTVEPPKTVSGDELQIGNPGAADSPITIVSGSGSGKELPSIHLGDVTVEGRGAGEIRAVKEHLDAAKVQREYRKVESPLGSVPISGTLNPNVAHLYGPYWYNEGDEVTIAITWTPATSTLRIGLTSQQSGTFYGCQVSGGAGTCRLRVNQAGWYYPTVWNLGPAAATYSGFVSW